MQVQIITPDQTVFEGESDSVTLPTGDGEITVLANHIPVVAILVPGTMVVRSQGQERLFAVSRGMAEVDGASIRILAETADRAEELQEEAIEKAKAEAERLLTERRHDVEGFAEATAMLDRELARLRSVRRHRSRTITRPMQ